MLLSACMIVRDEAVNIASCLVSLRSLADEVIVVDTGSKDNTKQIAIEHGAKVFDYEWDDDFAAARNYSISKASGKWLMWVDADDIVPTQTATAIKHTLLDDSARVIWLRLQNVSIEQSLEPNIEQIRIWPNGMGLCFKCGVDKRLHESIGQSYKIGSLTARDKWAKTGLSICNHTDGQPVLMESEHRQEEIFHYGYADPDVVRKKIDRDIRLRMIGMGCDPELDWFWFNIDKYRCVYAPNVLILWDRLNPAAMGEPFTPGHVPADDNGRRERIVSAAIDLYNGILAEDNTPDITGPVDLAIQELSARIKTAYGL